MKIIGYDACIYDVLRDCVTDEDGVIYGTAKEAADHAEILAQWTESDPEDAAVRIVYADGRREVMRESVAAIANIAALSNLSEV